MSSPKGNGKGPAPPPPGPRKTVGAPEGSGYLARAAERKQAAAAEGAVIAPGTPGPEQVVAVDPWLDTSVSERFEVGDPAAMAYLEEHGYVVMKSVADVQQLVHAEALLWDFMEEHADWKRSDPDSWTDEGLSRVSANGIANGLINKRGAGQSEVDWYVRTLPRVRAVYEQVWGTHDLLTSFDCFGLFRPWHSGKFMKTLGGWFHVDQGPNSEGKQCVQGLLSLFDQNATTGGLTVIPGSHRHFAEIGSTATSSVDYTDVSEDMTAWQAPHRLVTMQAGDFVLWDSRCVHCNMPATEPPISPPDRLLRAVVYVCMTPREKASDETLKDRKHAYNTSMTTTHWPHKHVKGFGFRRTPPLDFDTSAPERQALI